MDYRGLNRSSIRSLALKRLAILSIDSNAGLKMIKEPNPLGSFMDICPHKVINIRSFEILIATADAAGQTKKYLEYEDQLFNKFAQLLQHSFDIVFAPSVFRLHSKTSVWKIFATKIALAILNLGLGYEQLFTRSLEIFDSFIDDIFSQDFNSSAKYQTVLGFLEALDNVPQYIVRSTGSYNLFMKLNQRLDNPDFLMNLEEFSSKETTLPSNITSNACENKNIISPIIFLANLSKLKYKIISSILKSENLIEETLCKFSSKYQDEEMDIDTFKNEYDVESSKYTMLKDICKSAFYRIEQIDKGEPYLAYSTIERLKLGFVTKAFNLKILTVGILFDLVDANISRSILATSLGVQQQTIDPNIGLAIFQFGSFLIYRDSSIGPYLTRAFTSLVADPSLDFEYCKKLSRTMGLASKIMPQDSVVTTLYALTNLLSRSEDTIRARNSFRKIVGYKKSDTFSIKEHSSMFGNSTVHSSNKIEKLSSRTDSVVDDYSKTEFLRVCQNAMVGVSEISKEYGDENVTTLAVTILSQKVVNVTPSIGKILLGGLVSCAPYLPEREFIVLAKFLNRMTLDSAAFKDEEWTNAASEARIELSRKVKRTGTLFNAYLRDILQNIVSQGNVQELEHHRSHDEICVVAERLGLFLKPLAELLPDGLAGEEPIEWKARDSITLELFRNIWFNMVVHGYSANSDVAKRYEKELSRIAYNSPPLASSLFWNKTETSLELNTVLRRGSSNHNVKDHKRIVDDICSVHRSFSYSKLMFLAATVFCESIRVKTGICSSILLYQSDPSMGNSGIEKYLYHISLKIVSDYISLARVSIDQKFNQEAISNQLAILLTLCCHRSEELQNTAVECCDKIISRIPSSLCHKNSLFTLFDIMSLMYDSIIDSDINQYDPVTVYTGSRTGVQISLSDSYTWRESTFDKFHQISEKWLKQILTKSNYDVKALISEYITEADFNSPERISFGISFALNMAGTVLNNDRELSNVSKFAKIDTLPEFVFQLSWTNSSLYDMIEKEKFEDSNEEILDIRKSISEIEDIIKKESHISVAVVSKLLNDIANQIFFHTENFAESVRYITYIPFLCFNSAIMDCAFRIWLNIVRKSHKASVFLLGDVASEWERSIRLRKGLFSTSHDSPDVPFLKMEYSPSDFKLRKKISGLTKKSFEPHLMIIRLFASHFGASLNQSKHLLLIFTRFVFSGLNDLKFASLHPYSQLPRFELIRFAFDVLSFHVRYGSKLSRTLTESIINGILSWFRAAPGYPYGSDVLYMKSTLQLLQDVAYLLSTLQVFGDENLEKRKYLAELFIQDDINRIFVWLSPMKAPSSSSWKKLNNLESVHIIDAFHIDPVLALNLGARMRNKSADLIIQNLVVEDPVRCLDYHSAVQYFLGIGSNVRKPTYHLLFWKPVSPADSIMLFLPPYGDNPYVIQYSMRSLQHHDVNLTFFYVPQIVQCLRFDHKGYVERFIIETAKISQKFAHQIIWNMLANSYKDEDSQIPDPMKPILDRTRNDILGNLSEDNYLFYKNEFDFFNEITSISGKLKPYIKKSKAEKKLKIDEEMAKIQILEDVYLPSNPDGTVIDINRKSGKPLQSHAKAPFMATFKIKKTALDVDEDGREIWVDVEKWQSAIFKVGDDCRQDILALQLISIFRSIWDHAGLDLFVYPNRVTATAPGCGVIDVLPNSISRDMLGREAVNGLYEYYTTKFGPESTVEFQQARNNLIRSLAAYSIISYLLQFKDRHNGNIMYDDQGHILHIDFGFCFDIVPGGVKFEAAPFKLTHEMVLVLGGSTNTQAFSWFEELCIKGYLACRPHMNTIIRAVIPMLESGMPCFKPATIKKLQSRFVPEKSDHEAALFMRHLIKKSLESYYTKGYDEFQRITNGIPY